MRSWLVGLTCLAVGSASLLAQGARMGPPAGALTTGTGIVLGQVVDAATGQPIDSASVLLRVPGSGVAGGDVMTTQILRSGTAGPGVPAGPPRGPAGPLRVLTDGDGHFVFHDLPAGSFPLTVTAPGYVTGAYGQTRPNGASHPVVLTDGGRLGDVKVRLWKLAAITGMVTDDLGEPAVGITVRALHRNPGVGSSLLSAGSTTTDDRGEYRLAPLTPGDYLVAIPQTAVTMPVATVEGVLSTVMTGRGQGGGLLDLMASGGPQPQPGGVRIGDNLLQVAGDTPIGVGAPHGFPPSSGGAPSAYLTEYFPTAVGPAQAAVLTLTSGEEKSGINFQLRVAQTATVTGSIVGPTGPLGNAAIRLTPAAVDDAALPSGFETATTLTRADGSFTLLAVPAGQYTLHAVKMPRPVLPDNLAGNPMMSALLGPMGASDPSLPTVPLYGQATVAVSNANVLVDTIVLRAGARVSGRIAFVGSGAPPRAQLLQNLHVVLTSTGGMTAPGGRGFGPNAQPAVDANGQFKTDGYAPGRYTVSVTGPVPPGWTLESAVVNGRDVLTTPLDLAFADLDGAVLTYTDKATQVSGAVRGLATDENAVVLLFPADVKTWAAEGFVDRRFSQTPSTGRYVLSRVLPGDYCVVALRDGDVPDNPTAAFFETLAGIGVQVSVAEGDQKTVDLTVARIR